MLRNDVTGENGFHMEWAWMRLYYNSSFYSGEKTPVYASINRYHREHGATISFLESSIVWKSLEKMGSRGPIVHYYNHDEIPSCLEVVWAIA